jgi:hypothetical protein
MARPPAGQTMKMVSRLESGTDEGLYRHLARLRWERYPQIPDFLQTVGSAQRFGFCEIGRLLDALLTSIYMVERRTLEMERRNLIRLLDFVGHSCAFITCSPRGSVATAQGLFGDRMQIEGATDAAMVHTSDGTRWWIKRLHWELRHFERSMKVADWLRKVRSSIPLSGNARFLSGIDWSWIDEVIAASRIKPFAGHWSSEGPQLRAQAASSPASFELRR